MDEKQKDNYLTDIIIRGMLVGGLLYRIIYQLNK